VVRNTFIDAVVDDPYEAPERTRSDPTGGRTKCVLPFGRPDRIEGGMRILEHNQSTTTPLPEGTSAEEAGDDENLSELVPVKGGLSLCSVREDTVLSGPCCFDGDDDSGADAGNDEEEEEDEEDGSLGTLGKTKSSAYPQAKSAPSAGYRDVGLADGESSAATTGGVTTVDLDKLLPEDDQQAMYGGSLEPAYAGFSMPAAGTEPGWDYSSMPYDMSAVGAVDWNTAMQGYAAFQQASTPSDWRPPELPELGSGPPLGVLHSFHQEARDMGQVTSNFRMFTKVGFEGRLSVVSESRVHTDGMHRYLVQFSAGELSRADGVGFVFSSRLPCAKNIQRIVSIFVNQRGRICMRVFADIVRASAYVKPLELGDWVEMAIDLDQKVATFNIWPRTPTGWPNTSGQPASTAEFPFGNKLAKVNQAGVKPVKLNVGHLACVVKNVGVTVTLGS